ncbi:MAG: DUF945 family protein, partial [Pusillimonas sp.]|nr:DUF945 family protein [Pusillimonas sp.]
MKVVKPVLFSLVILVVLYGASSWYMGQQAQALIEHKLAQANEQVLKGVGPEAGFQGARIRIRNYERG